MLLQKPFDGTLYNMTGSKYAMLEADALTYGEPYQASHLTARCSPDKMILVV
jgi:hypothetical protein